MRVLIILLIASLAACSPSTDDTKNSSIETIDAQNATLEVDVKSLDDNRVQFLVTTNIPTPIEVMAGVSIKGQAPDDTFIGHNEKVTLENSETKFIIDTSNSQDPLPAGKYEAEVSFYPLWGAKNGNPAAASAPEIHTKSDITLIGSGTDRTSAERKNKLQRWVMNNLGMNEPWNRATYEEKLGTAQKGPSTMSHLHDAYYFPDADMTLLVNRLKGEVTVWRMGDVTE